MEPPPKSARGDAELPATARRKAGLLEALRNTSYEVLPFESTKDEVLAHVPGDVALTVTTTEAKGIDATIELAIELSKNGYRVAPHLAARLVRDREHLDDIAVQLQEFGVDGVFAIGGDAAEPAGPFPDAASLLIALQEQGHVFSSIGIAGYPEGHGTISQQRIDDALRSKAVLADEITTQLCFDADATVGWAREVRAGGVRLPIRVGLPGAINRQKLIRISAGLGLGQSAKFLKKQSNMFWRFFLPGGYNPDKLVRNVARQLARGGGNIRGFHMFTFNELASTEKWRQRWMSALT
ncbi:methylenetetrahydrofolate reductase [Bounagaea algeriensis]